MLELAGKYQRKSRWTLYETMVEQRFYRGKALVVGNEHYDQVKPDLDKMRLDRKFKRDCRIW